MTTTLIYYSFLFAFVIIAHFFKFIKSDEKRDKIELLFLGQEIVFASAGIFIIILEKDKNNLAAIAIIYTFLVFISTASDSSDIKKFKKIKVFINITILVIILIGTFIYLPNLEEKINKSYTVIIPYYDNTLKKNVGEEKFGERQLFFYKEISCNNEKQAIEYAKAEFYKLQISKPIYPDIKEIDEKIIQNDSNIIIKKGVKR
jgi:hypothetical protein